MTTKPLTLWERQLLAQDHHLVGYFGLRWTLLQFVPTRFRLWVLGRVLEGKQP